MKVALAWNVASLAMNVWFFALDPSRWWAMAGVGFHLGLIVCLIMLLAAYRWRRA